MPKIYLSDKQKPKIPTEATLDEVLKLTALCTPGDRLLVDMAPSPSSPAQFNLRTAMGNMPLGRHDAELAAICTPELVRGLLYKIALLDDAKREACNMLQDVLAKDMTPSQAVKLKKLLEAGDGEL